VRKIGRLVSDLRDAQVRLQTLVQLRDETSKGPEESPFPRIEELLSLERESFSAAFAGWQKQAIPQLERVEARLLKWPLDGLTWKQVCGAVGKIYKRGQRGLAKTIDDPEPENFHAWRKRVKDIWYQLRILQHGPDRDGPRRRSLRRVTRARARFEFSLGAPGDGKGR